MVQENRKNRSVLQELGDEEADSVPVSPVGKGRGLIGEGRGLSGEGRSLSGEGRSHNAQLWTEPLEELQLIRGQTGPWQPRAPDVGLLGTHTHTHTFLLNVLGVC